MKQTRRHLNHPRFSSGSLQPDDGVDPRLDHKETSSSNAQADRKAAQLCAQIHRALDFVIPELLADSAMDAMVMDVQPAPNTAHLLVRLQAMASATEVACRELESILAQKSGAIRTAVAQSIHRRKTPTLSFRVISS